MKKAIFITVRSASTRLPAKCFLEIEGIAVIEHLINRIKKSKEAEGIVLCTTALPEDDRLCDIAKKNGIQFYRGPVKDKMMRWLGAVKKFGVEFFVTADGDDIFCEPELIDLAFEQYGKTQADFIEGKGVICGAFTYGIKGAALRKACEIKNTEDTEMMWVYFNQTGLFQCEELKGVPSEFKRPQIRMTLDYEDDFKFFKTIISNFYAQGKLDFNLKDIVRYLDAHPEIVGINQYLQEKFLQNQKNKTKLLLKKEV